MDTFMLTTAVFELV